MAQQNSNTITGMTISGPGLMKYPIYDAGAKSVYSAGAIVHSFDVDMSNSTISMADKRELRLQKLGDIFRETLEIIEDPEAEDRDFEELRAELVEVLAAGISIVEGSADDF